VDNDLTRVLFLIVNHDNIGSVTLPVRRRLVRAYKDLLRRWWLEEAAVAV
jgi:hypothetical protein